MATRPSQPEDAPAADDPRALQLDYYARTAATYDADQVHPDDEHRDALEIVALLLPGLGARTVLDTGCGTGRGIRYLRERLPGLRVRGNDPSADLLRVARERHGVPEADLVCSDTASLPDAPGSHDVVMSLGVLHHVQHPTAVVERMVDLAAKAVFISDANYLGQGPAPLRLLKLALTAAGLWRPVKFVAQGFKPYARSEADGIFYSYSAFNDLAVLQRRCARVWAIPVGRDARAAAQWPKLAARSVLLCGLK